MTVSGGVDPRLRGPFVSTWYTRVVGKTAPVLHTLPLRLAGAGGGMGDTACCCTCALSASTKHVFTSPAVCNKCRRLRFESYLSCLSDTHCRQLERLLLQNGTTPLMWAAYRGDCPMASMLLSSAMDPHIVCDAGDKVRARKGPQACESVCESRCPDCC